MENNKKDDFSKNAEMYAKMCIAQMMAKDYYNQLKEHENKANYYKLKFENLNKQYKILIEKSLEPFDKMFLIGKN